jgi:uncharacterized protein DUF2585
VHNKKIIWPAVVIGLMLMATAAFEHLQGRLWKCECSSFIWTSNAWGSQTSQLFFDPYSFTHLLHGFMFAGILTLLIRNLSRTWRFVVAIALECCWEMIENSNTVIDRYRQATAALGYHGDSVFNSFGDIFCCGLGFALAARLGWRWGVAMFIAVELGLTLWIRDSLLLEILMLVHPVNSIKTWQLGH